MQQWRRVRVSACFFYFAFMEGIQFIQYLVIDDCTSKTNIVWTILGFLHICFQPLFSNLAMSGTDRNNRDGKIDYIWRFIIKLSFVTGVMMALRIILPMVYDGKNEFLEPCSDDTEGFCAPRTCTETGLYHLKWTFKLLTPNYAFPGISMHCINMFVVPVLMKQYLAAVVLFLTGPFIAMFFSATSGEQASIWCFFSIAETALTTLSQLYYLRKYAKESTK